MRIGRSLFRAFMPWAGLVAGLIAAVIVHQVGSDGTFDHCQDMAPLPVIVVALLGLATNLAGGFASWQRVRSTDGASRVVAIISVGMALLFAFFILLPIFAAALIPPCFQ